MVHKIKRMTPVEPVGGSVGGFALMNSPGPFPHVRMAEGAHARSSTSDRVSAYRSKSETP